MLMLRRLLRPVCCALVGALLFAQAAFAMRPCVEPGMSAATAISTQSNDGCCETTVVELNLCASQCGDSYELPGGAYLFTPPGPHVIGYIEFQASRNLGAAEWLRLQRDLIPDPPSTLRFCCFLI